MTTWISPYLFFGGNCREAYGIHDWPYYEDALGKA